MSHGAFAFDGLRRVSPAAELTFDGRVNDPSAKIRVKSPLEVRGVDGSKAWFDARWIDVDYSSGENLTLVKYDVLTQGPLAGFRIRFWRETGESSAGCHVRAVHGSGPSPRGHHRRGA
jgi:hypothetical protein